MFTIEPHLPESLMLLRNLLKWVSWYLRNSISCSLFFASTSFLSLFLFSMASIFDLSSMTLFSSFVFFDSSSSIFFSKSALPCSAWSYFLIAKVTELNWILIWILILPLIESLIGSDCHLDFISDSQKKETSLRFIESYLSDDFIETLREKFFSHGTNAALSCLAFHQLLIKHFSQASNINSSSFLVRNVLDEMLA